MAKNTKEWALFLLKKAEPIIKTDLTYLLRGSFWLGSQQMISAGLSFLLAIFFARYVSQEVYGTYRYVLSVAGILGISALRQMDTALIRAVAKGKDGTLRTVVRKKFTYSLFGAAAALGVAGYYFIQDNQTLAIAFLITAVAIPFLESVNLIYEAFFIGKKRFRTLALFGVINRGGVFLVLAIALIVSGQLIPLLIFNLAASAILNLILYAACRKYYSDNDDVDAEAVPFGKHLSAIGVFDTAILHADKLILFHFLGAAEVAIYTFATTPADTLRGLFKLVGNLALPKFAQHSARTLHSNLYRKISLLFITCAVGVLGYILFAPLLYKILFPQYIESVIYSQVFAISIVATASIVPYTALQSRGATKELWYFNAPGNIFQIILLIIFVPLYGIWGAVFAKMFSRFFNLIVSFFLINRYFATKSKISG